MKMFRKSLNVNMLYAAYRIGRRAREREGHRRFLAEGYPQTTAWVTVGDAEFPLSRRERGTGGEDRG
jgi:hypothetical protein